MKFYSRHLKGNRKSDAGFTLPETLMAVFIVLILMGFFAVLYINTNEAFFAMMSYRYLDKNSCNALDLLSKEIRGASAVTASTATYVTFANGTNTFQVVYDPTGQTLILKDLNGSRQIYNDTGNSTITNLTSCVSWTNTMFTGVPIMTTTNFTFNTTTIPSSCKVVQMDWKCQQSYIGKAMISESIKTAQIVLRNKTE
jgi:prepilin-type N-terminal cleavage/methylation domain-containing protein